MRIMVRTLLSLLCRAKSKRELRKNGVLEWLREIEKRSGHL